MHAPQATNPVRTAILSGYHWPTRDARITNAFGPGRPGSFLLDGVVFHDGIDLASFCGARILAAHDGVVLGAGRHTEGLLGWVGDLTAFRARVEAEDGWGGQAITVVIDDGNGYRSVYAHLGKVVVARGETVAAGDLLGYEGASGYATGCHLHYAVFNPEETATLTLDPKVARKTKLPPLEIARIDPLLVLPPLEDAGITWGWGAR
jgi:murein DD-endopeptidase MepM/ murein hydrolase activator NlpD